MAQMITLYWRDIPAQVIAERGRGRKREQAKIELHRRFAIAIDAAAMRDGADSTDDYLAEWRRGEPVECGEDLEAEAADRAAALEAEYPAERVKSLVDNGGREPG
ncbi:MAG: virulence factor [Pseudomonadota bacterium]|nr:virulence factor [Pseudomonadota bacterium]MEC8130599.1 virulence factor [Pseudomonadota bacterium]